MPLVRITIREGRSAEYKKALLDGVHNALVKAFKIPEHDRTQMVQELAHENFEAPPNKTENATVIEITAFRGRSLEAKSLLYRSLVDNLAKKPGIAPNDVTIILQEPPLENWGIRGGKPASEVSIGFKIDV